MISEIPSPAVTRALSFIFIYQRNIGLESTPSSVKNKTDQAYQCHLLQ